MRLRSALPFVGVLSVAAIASPVRGALADLIAGPLKLEQLTVVEPVAGSAPPSRATRLPSPSPAAISAALAAVKDDVRLRVLLGGADFQVTESGPWTTERTQRLLGTVLLLRLDHPTHVTGDWPTLSYDESERSDTPYTSVTRHRSIKGVSDLVLQVRRGDNRIVGVTLGPQSTGGSP
jgi:hypothetical protein